MATSLLIYAVHTGKADSGPASHSFQLIYHPRSRPISAVIVLVRRSQPALILLQHGHTVLPPQSISATVSEIRKELKSVNNRVGQKCKPLPSYHLIISKSPVNEVRFFIKFECKKQLNL